MREDSKRGGLRMHDSAYSCMCMLVWVYVTTCLNAYMHVCICIVYACLSIVPFVRMSMHVCIQVCMHPCACE